VPVTLRLEGADRLAATLARSPRVVAAEEARAMTASLLLIEGDARRNVRHDTRQLMNSITHRQRERGQTLIGEVGPSLRYGLYVERGSRPHFPPVAALVGWARRHGVSPYAVQRAVGRRGTRARPFLAPAFAKNADRIGRLFAAAGARITAMLAVQSGGRA
jgi:hypothetical protein